MGERKIFNYESKILVDETIEKYGYSPESLGNTSRKFVVAICRFCGKEHDIRKGFFNKSGSACHKECRIEEQKQDSPFKDPKVKEKAQKKIEEKYGKDRKKIRDKISRSNSSKEVKEKRKKTNIEKYGVENVFQSESIKNKIKNTNLKKYGKTHAMQSEKIKSKMKETMIKNHGVSNPLKSDKIKEKAKKTCIEKYGVENPMQNDLIKENAEKSMERRYGVRHPYQNKNILEKSINTLNKNYGVSSPLQSEEIKEKMILENIEKYGYKSPSQVPEIREKISNSWKKVIKEDVNNKFKLINELRKDELWEDLKNMTLKEISELYNINYNSLTNQLNKEEFKEKYNFIYPFPKHQQQSSIYKYILNIIQDSEVIQNTRKIISPLELDIYIPGKKFAIEFNGSYWHSEAILEPRDARKKHFKKTKMCHKKGIRLLHIFEHNWYGNEDKYKRYIKNILGLNKNKIMARKCVVTNDDAIDLIKENHLQGLQRGAIKFFTLKYNGEIVGVMTAHKHHRQNGDNNSIVLGRLVFKPEYNISGGASKLFKAFRAWAKEEGYDSIVSWSDNSYSNGDIYKTLGFDMEMEYGPDYFYFDIKNQCYKSKQSQKKSVTGCPKEITERDWCFDRGLYRIYDCGKKKWSYYL